MIGKICGTGSGIPVKIMDNDDLSNMVDTNDAWIRERTGVEKRHIAESESTVSMAVEAGRQALAQTGIRPEELDMIVVSTMSPDAVLPCTACEVQKAIGAEGAVCFDLQAACTGFIFAYNTAQAYIQSNMCRTVLLIGSERLSRLVDWTDRGTCILFGDGAGAAVLRYEECEKETFMYSNSMGDNKNVLTCKNNGLTPLMTSNRAVNNYMTMQGNDVFRFAIRVMEEAIVEVLKESNLTIDDIDCIIPHQANIRIIKHVARSMNLPMEKVFVNLDKYGNTSSASIGIALSEAKAQGVIKENDNVILVGFGGGFTYSSYLYQF